MSILTWFCLDDVYLNWVVRQTYLTTFRHIKNSRFAMVTKLDRSVFTVVLCVNGYRSNAFNNRCTEGSKMPRNSFISLWTATFIFLDTHRFDTSSHAISTPQKVCFCTIIILPTYGMFIQYRFIQTKNMLRSIEVFIIRLWFSII